MTGEKIGSYRVVREIGSGGMGAVYLAEHRHLGRKAAVKVLKKEFADRPDLLERFFSEARATSLIEHPGIVQVLDCEVDAGRPFIVMEYLAADTLSGVLRARGKLPAPLAAGVARRIAEALGAAHEKGIIHRDIKPENIFLTSEAPPAIKLVDFGIAKLAGEFAGGQMNRTQTGVMMGTPLYMSPEQCKGSGKVDQRTDIYSLGCVLFELLCGRPPFTGEGLGELVAAHITQAPPPPRDLEPSVPPALDAFVQQLLRKSAADRPQTMREVAAALAALEVSPGVSAAPAPATTPPRAPTRAIDTTLGAAASQIRDTADDAPPPSRRPAATIAVVAAAVVVAAGGALWMNRKSAPAPSAVETTTTSPRPTAAAATAEQPPAGTPPQPAAAPSAEPPPAPPVARATATAAAKPAARPTPARAATAKPATAPPGRAQAVPAPPVRVLIESDPPGAEVCLAADRQPVPRTGLEVPADGRRLAIFVRLPGHRVEEIAVRATKDVRRTVKLQRLGPDDLEADSPCR